MADCVDGKLGGGVSDSGDGGAIKEQSSVGVSRVSFGKLGR